MTKPTSIDLRIAELVLEGVGPRERDHLLASLQRQLADTLARGEYPRTSQTQLSANRPSDASPAELGGHIAKTITKGGQP